MNPGHPFSSILVCAIHMKLSITKEKDMHRISWRKFFESAALLGAASLKLPTALGGRRPKEAGWYDRPMRWAQLTLVENDPGQYEPKFWLDYFQRVHADAACLSAGGCVG